MSVNKPEAIIIHHSWKPEDNIVFEEWDNIRDYHINHNGWSDIGYHYGLEYVNGEVKVQIGRNEDVQGAHTLGMNLRSIGICVIGNYDEQDITSEIFDALVTLCVDIRSRYGKLPIEPHNKYADYKTCPGTKFPMDKLILEVEKVEHWSKKYYDKIGKFIPLFEERFDDTLTRGEMFKLIYYTMLAIVENSSKEILDEFDIE